MKILNLYAGIGGNRKLWGDKHEITAVENIPKIAKIYQDFFPGDKVIITDAHQYLLDHFKEFDFIWSSPPCPTHSKIRYMATKGKPNKEKNRNQLEKKYPSMDLYQEIIFLTHYFKGNWVVENVIGYYEPLIKPQISGKHYFWCNFIISDFIIKNRGFQRFGINRQNIDRLQKKIGFNLEGKDLGYRKDQILRNCVEPKLGLHIFKCAFKDKQKTL